MVTRPTSVANAAAPDAAAVRLGDVVRRRLSATRIRALTLAVWIVIIGGWEAVAHLLGRTSAGGEETIPSIESMIRAFPVLSNYWTGDLGIATPVQGGEASIVGGLLGLAYNSGATLIRLVAGLLLGVIAGIGLAVSISWSSHLRQMMAFPAHFVRMMPVLAMVPLFTLWFGNRDRGAIIFIGFSAFVVLFVITLNAIGNVPPYHAQWARCLGGRSARVYLTVILPAVLPQLRVGILLALGFGWSAAIASELLGQRYGLGRIVVDASFFGRTSLMALVGVFTVIYAALSYLLVARVLMHVTRWAE
jgi:sulfonate transport system permease protein